MWELIKKLLVRKDELKKRLTELAAPVNDDGELRALTEDENAEFISVRDEIASIDERVKELSEQEARDQADAKHRVELGLVDKPEQKSQTATVTVVEEPNPVYRKDQPTGPSFFRDLAAFQLSNGSLGSISEARDRLVRSQETRAGDMTTVAGAGGEFAPPAWLISDFVTLARGGRVTADLCHSEVLPSGISSVHLPKVASGTTVGVQATQNSALSDTAMTTTSVSSGITTIGGKQIISMQLLQQSGIPFDRVILGDLAAAYAVGVDNQVLYGSNGSGQLNGLVNVANNTAFTSSSPAPASVTNANSLYYTVQKAAAAAQTSIFMPVDAVVMHPSRWAWILGSVDANARPYVIPDGGNYNPLGVTGQQVAQGPAGHFGSYPVYTDPNISLAANSATNQDEIYLIRRDECWLYESPVQTASFDATYADNASVLFRVLGYLAFIANRRSGAVQSIRGTGLVNV